MLSEKDKMLSGLAHQPYEPELQALRLKNKELLYEYNVF